MKDCGRRQCIQCGLCFNNERAPDALCALQNAVCPLCGGFVKLCAILDERMLIMQLSMCLRCMCTNSVHEKYTAREKAILICHALLFAMCTGVLCGTDFLDAHLLECGLALWTEHILYSRWLHPALRRPGAS